MCPSDDLPVLPSAPRPPSPPPSLRYVEYETQLEALRAARQASRAITGKKSLAEFCIVRRIHFIYERCTRKFRGDLSLWSRWLRFCQRSASRRQKSAPAPTGTSGLPMLTSL